MSVENKPKLDEGEIELLKAALKMSYKERFLMTTRLYKVHQTMQKASIQHKLFISK